MVSTSERLFPMAYLCFCDTLLLQRSKFPNQRGKKADILLAQEPMHPSFCSGRQVSSGFTWHDLLCWCSQFFMQIDIISDLYEIGLDRRVVKKIINLYMCIIYIVFRFKHESQGVLPYHNPDVKTSLYRCPLHLPHPPPLQRFKHYCSQIQIITFSSYEIIKREFKCNILKCPYSDKGGCYKHMKISRNGRVYNR